MGILNENQIMGASAAGGDYEIEQSLRFNDNDTASLSRTPSVAGNQKTWTLSCWVKRGDLANQGTIFEAATSGAVNTIFYLYGTTLYLTGSTSTYDFVLSQVFRDASAWYHLMIAMDTTQSTASNRTKIYINGSIVTAFATETYPSLNLNTTVNSTIAHSLGKRAYDTSLPWDGYMAEVNFIDGQALTPDSFGETGTYGEWKPTKYAGTYGTNGFYLTFAGGGVMSATGGNSTATDGDYKAASFTSSGTFTPSADGFVEYLVIGGGGSGGASGNGTSGGGGAGGYRTGFLPVIASTAYSITVGAGATSGGSSGADSVFSTITSNGGGGGGSRSNTESSRLGKTGGSAGGSAISDGSPLGVIPSVAGNEGGFSPVEGNAGGASANFQGGDNASAAMGAGGGGGASAAGAAGSGQSGGAGGAGTASSITGSSVTRAGGGGGAAGQNGTLGAGGSGGGGGGGKESTNGVSGTTNKGAGGGGCPRTNASGFGAGGSGIVIIRYQFQ